MKISKTQLTAEEKITVSWAHLVKGVDQHTLAAMYNVNPGRVAEAIAAVRDVVGTQKGGTT